MDKEQAQKQALDLVEEILFKMMDSIVKPYAREYVKGTENKWDDAVLLFLDDIVDYIKKEAIDRINGEDDI